MQNILMRNLDTLFTSTATATTITSINPKVRVVESLLLSQFSCKKSFCMQHTYLQVVEM